MFIRPGRERTGLGREQPTGQFLHVVGDSNPAQPSMVPAAGGSLGGISCLDSSSLPVDWDGALEQKPTRDIAIERRWAWLQLCIRLCWLQQRTLPFAQGQLVAIEIAHKYSTAL